MKDIAVAADCAVPVASRASEIDALRCLAMTFVVLVHKKLMPAGWIGVWLFFVISGYVVTKSMVDRETTATGRARLRHFFGRRVGRIVPIYYIYITVGICLSLMQGHDQDWFAVASLFGFYNNYAMIIAHGDLAFWPVTHLWTISTEMQFYAVYGVSLCLMPKRFTIGLLIALVALAPIARAIASDLLTREGWAPLPLAYAIYAGPGLHADVFAMGALLAFAGKRWPLAAFARPLAAAGMAAICAYSVLYLGINHTVLGERGFEQFRNVVSGILYGQYREVFLYSALGLWGTGLVALAASRDNLVCWLLGNKILQWIGTVSYGAYIFHPLILYVVAYFCHGWWGAGTAPGPGYRIAEFLVSYALILIAAWLSFRFVETPLSRPGKPSTNPWLRQT